MRASPGSRLGYLPGDPHLPRAENLPHAPTGSVEDADSKAPDHAMDAMRYLLLNLGGGPQFPIFDDPVPGLLDGIEVLQDAGLYAARRSPLEDLFDTVDPERENAGTTQRSPFA
jgi:hypothetical protein